MKDDQVGSAAAVQDFLTTISAVHRHVVAATQQYDSQWREIVAKIARESTSIFERARAAAASLQVTLAPALQFYIDMKMMEEAGWLPHYTSPFSLIAENGTADISAIIEDHCTKNWTSIKERFLEPIDDCEIDQESKETFREALLCHELGLYRSTCRTLFPEIERVMRIELLDGKPGGISSMKRLQNMAGDLGLSEMRPHGLAGMSLYSRLIDHIYVPVENLEQLNSVSGDAVPNRQGLSGILCEGSQ